MAESIRTAAELIRIYYQENIPVYLSGPPGLGKSSIYQQLADELKIGFIDVRLSMMDPVDLLGLPTVKDGESMWAKPSLWPNEKRDGKKGIILFDELSDVTRSMQSATYQIILDRKIGPHVLLPGWYPVAAGNRREDKAAAGLISSALANRFAHIDVAQDTEAFVQWADKAGIDPYIIGFIRFRPALLLDMKSEGDLRAFPTPRSWATASKIINKEPKLRMRLLQGIVGAGAAAEFDGYMRTMNLPDFDDIIKNPKKTQIPSEPGSKYALASMLARYATRENLGAVYEYTKRPEFGKDFCICTMIDATTRDSGLTETKAFMAFANENTDLNM